MSNLVNLSTVELTWESATKVLIHFVNKAQQKSAFKLQEAGVLYKAVGVFSGEEKNMSEMEALQMLVNGLHIGQASGAFTLEEAGLLQNRFLPFIDQESKKRKPGEKITELEA